MATDDNFSTRVRPGSNILAMLDREVLVEVPKPAEQATPGLDGFGELTLLPDVGDPYVAHARPGNGVEETLYCIDREGFFKGFAWSTFERIDLVRPEHPGGGPVLVLRFHGSEVSEVTIEGGNLKALRVFLGRRRLIWIRELGEEKAFTVGPNEAVITRITVQNIDR